MLVKGGPCEYYIWTWARISDAWPINCWALVMRTVNLCVVRTSKITFLDQNLYLFTILAFDMFECLYLVCNTTRMNLGVLYICWIMMFWYKYVSASFLDYGECKHRNLHKCQVQTPPITQIWKSSQCFKHRLHTSQVSDVFGLHRCVAACLLIDTRLYCLHSQTARYAWPERREDYK